MSPKIETIYISLSHPSVTIFINCVYMLEEQNKKCLILHPNMFQSWNTAPMLKNNNLSYIAENHLGVTILKNFVYGWQINVTAEF